LPAAAWYVPIVGVRFFRAPRGKTAHIKMKSTALPKAQHANGVSPTVIDTTYAITY